MGNIYLIRHLKTKHNIDGVYMGQGIDPPILSQSIGGFEATLRRTEIASLKRNITIFSSPARRCLQTAEIIRKATCLETTVKIERAFAETDYGKFEGLNVAQIRERYPHLIDNWMYHPSRVTFPEGESFQQVQKRACGRFANLTYKNTGTVIIITHVDVIKLIVARVLQIQIDSKRYFCINNGSVTRLERNGEEIRVKYINVT